LNVILSTLEATVSRELSNTDESAADRDKISENEDLVSVCGALKDINHTLSLILKTLQHAVERELTNEEG